MPSEIGSTMLGYIPSAVRKYYARLLSIWSGGGTNLGYLPTGVKWYYARVLTIWSEVVQF